MGSFRENSQISVKKLIDICKYEIVEKKLILHYGCHNLKKYRKLYAELRGSEVQGIKDFYIHISAYRKSEDEDSYVEDFDENDSLLIFDVGGYNLNESDYFSIAAMPFSEFLTCQIDEETLCKYTAETILAHCLYEVTSYGYNDSERRI